MKDGESLLVSRTDALRDIPLADLLASHGFKVCREGASFRAKNDRHNIFTTGQRWFDNAAGVGGGGAIDLQMHLAGGDFTSACRALAAKFGRENAAAQIAAAPVSSRPEERTPFRELASRYAVPDENNWPVARAYLVETRCIDAALVDELHALGSIFANDHRPNPSLVFLHRTPCGRVEGATLRDTRHDSAFRPSLGNKLSAWFAIGSLESNHSIVAVESPIDALSYFTLYSGRDASLAVVSCPGATVPLDLMRHAHARRQAFVVALDRDAAGERGWSKAWDATADWSGFKIVSECPQRKDWNADLVAASGGTHCHNPRHFIPLKP